MLKLIHGEFNLNNDKGWAILLKKEKRKKEKIESEN